MDWQENIFLIRRFSIAARVYLYGWRRVLPQLPPCWGHRLTISIFFAVLKISHPERTWIMPCNRRRVVCSAYERDFRTAVVIIMDSFKDSIQRAHLETFVWKIRRKQGPAFDCVRIVLKLVNNRSVMVLLVRKTFHFGVFKLYSKSAANQMRVGTWQEEEWTWRGLEQLYRRQKLETVVSSRGWWSNLLNRPQKQKYSSLQGYNLL